MLWEPQSDKLAGYVKQPPEDCLFQTLGNQHL